MCQTLVNSHTHPKDCTISCTAFLVKTFFYALIISTDLRRKYFVPAFPLFCEGHSLKQTSWHITTSTQLQADVLIFNSLKSGLLKVVIITELCVV